MKLESLTVALRLRTPWEAIELGLALARTHARAILLPWLAVTAPPMLALNALCWWLGVLWAAPVAMWWLKPAFDRIPLYVLSRAAFGEAPRPARTLREVWRWGRPFLLAHLTWRRLSPMRALYLPVDLLEGGRGDAARARRAMLGGPVYGVAAVTLLVFVNFEVALNLGLAAFAALFVPAEQMADAAQWFWQQLQRDPTWLALANNVLAWVALSVIEPFYVASGFGLYLARRTELEGWDIELALRRLRARLAAPATALLLLVGLGAPIAAPRAQDAPPRLPAAADPAQRDVDGAERATSTPQEVFGDALAPTADFRDAVRRAYLDPRVRPTKTVTRWKPKADPKQAPEPSELPAWLRPLGAIFAFLAEYGLWLLVGLLLLALALTTKHWWPWLRAGASREAREPAAARVADVAPETPLPEDILAAARRLWQDGRARDALALVYRASVAAMIARVDVVLVPGATEAECLRASRRMPEAGDRAAFAEAVRTWQLAAYAQRLPAADAFERLLDTVGRRFGWTA